MTTGNFVADAPWRLSCKQTEYVNSICFHKPGENLSEIHSGKMVAWPHIIRKGRILYMQIDIKLNFWIYIYIYTSIWYMCSHTVYGFFPTVLSKALLGRQ